MTPRRRTPVGAFVWPLGPGRLPEGTGGGATRPRGSVCNARRFSSNRASPPSDGVLKNMTMSSLSCAASRCLPALWVLMTACSSHSSSRPGGLPDEPKPIAECQAYEQALARCSGVDASVAGPALSTVKTEAQRAQLRDLCALNLQRINSTCR